MGMFDTLLDANGEGWQTKALGQGLSRFRIGDPIPSDSSAAYQVEILGEPTRGEFVDSLATIRGGVLVSVNDPRDERLPLIDYGGYLAAPAKDI